LQGLFYNNLTIKIMDKTVKIIALKDIAEWMKTQNIQIRDEHGDVWVVTASKIDTPKQRKLNRELGISKVNYTSLAMKRIRQSKI
jgi:ribosome biogenesis SPOUT family RNA methylase Rps3